MSESLIKVPFDESQLPLLADFDCGSKPCEREVSDWIKDEGDFGVVNAIKKWGTRVWIYVNKEKEVVGYASLGKSKWKLPGPDDPRVIVNLIPSLGIQTRFKGKPEGARENRYSVQIMRDLIHEARNTVGTEPILALFVHPSNIAAIRFYEYMGFEVSHQRSKGEDSSVEYIGMLRRIP